MTISHLLRRIHEGVVVLPAIQRDFAWPPQRIFRLLDSLLQGFPIGIVLIWETYQDIHYRTFVADIWPRQIHSILDNGQKRKLGVVLDGQQRLQSLFSALCGTYKGKSLYLDVLSGRTMDDTSRQKYDFKFMDAADFQKWQKTFESGPNQYSSDSQAPAYYARVVDLYALYARQKAEFRKQLAESLSLPLEAQERVEINIDCLNEVLSRNTNVLKVAVIDEDLPSDAPHRKTEADVLEIFVRINREGQPLSRSELTFSMLKLNWMESAVSLPEFVERINVGNFFKIDTDFIIRCLFAVSGLGTGFDPDLLRKPSMVARIKGHFPQCCDAIRSTIDTVLKVCGCSSSELIGGANTLVPLVYYLFHTHQHELPEEQVSNFRKALYLFGFARPFSGNTESRLRKFIRRELQPLAERGDHTFPFASAVWWVKYWQGYTSFSSDLLRSNGRLALHVLQGSNGSKAQYWRNAEELDHIFPRSELLKKGFDESEIDDVANLWILPKDRNMNKSNKPPAEYFQDVDDAEMEAALIDRQLLRYSTFRTFLRTRGKRMLETVKERLEFTDRDFRVPLIALKPMRQTVPKLPPARSTPVRAPAVSA